MSAIDPSVYGAILKVREARRFDIACLLMRMYGYMMNIGTVAMLTLAGYSFFVAGLVSSVIALAIFIIAPRLGKLVDERGQSKVIPVAVAISLSGLIVLLLSVHFHGPVWLLLVAAIVVGSIPNAQALSRTRWTYLLRTGKLGKGAPGINTIFSYEGILDDVAFMISPALSIFLASSITPVAGLALGGTSFLVGAILLPRSKDTEPKPGWEAEGKGSSEKDGARNADSQDNASRVANAETSADTANPTHATPKTQARKREKSIFRTSPAVRVLFILMLLLGSFFGTFDTTTVAFAEELGEPNIASGALMISALFSIVMGFLFGMMRLTVPHYKLVLTTAICIGVAYGSMALITDVVSLYVVSCFGALFYAPFLIVMNGACERAVPGKRLTEAITWLNAGATCGLAIGPTVAGVMVDLMGASAGFAVGAALALAIPLIALIRRRTIKKGCESATYKTLGMA